MTDVTWVLEPDIFLETHAPIRSAIRGQGHRLIDWSDSWWADGIPAHVPSSSVIFHGSLGNAAQIAEQLKWLPGSFCPVKAFHCSAWYGPAREWLVHNDWIICPADELISNAENIATKLSSGPRLFVRPDSPLKPFSGRVVDVSSVTLASLDHGFYYDDETLPVVAAPVQTIGNEWRFVIARQRVIAGSAYDPTTRGPVPHALNSDAAAFAAMVASQLPPPSDVYVLDVCESNGQLRLLELNPFGGADLYACDPNAIVDSVSAIAGAA